MPDATNNGSNPSDSPPPTTDRSPDDHKPARDTMKTIVLKLGGAVCLRPETLDALTVSLRAMLAAGIRPVLVHGGGPQLDKEIQALGEAVVKHHGLRYTSEQAAAVVERVLDGIGAEVTAALRHAGLPAVHLGAAARLVRAETKALPDGFDLGRVGSFRGIDATALAQATVAAGAPTACIPVITPVGYDADGPLNVNADEAAAGIAAAIKADRLFLATDVPAVLDADGKPLGTIDEAQAAALIMDGAAEGGMIPKLMASLSALEGGVRDVMVTEPTAESLAACVLRTPKVGTRILVSPKIRISFKQDTVQVHPVEA